MTFPRITTLVLSIAAAMTISAHASSDVGTFSFAYSFEKDRSIAPFQVFDDGTSTFLQYRDKSRVPTFLIKDAKGTRVITPEEDGPYLRIDEVAARIELVAPDGKTAAIVSTKRKPVQLAVASNSQIKPSTAPARGIDSALTEARVSAVDTALNAAVTAPVAPLPAKQTAAPVQPSIVAKAPTTPQPTAITYGRLPIRPQSAVQQTSLRTADFRDQAIDTKPQLAIDTKPQLAQAPTATATASVPRNYIAETTELRSQIATITKLLSAMMQRLDSIADGSATQSTKPASNEQPQSASHRALRHSDLPIAANPAGQDGNPFLQKASYPAPDAPVRSVEKRVEMASPAIDAMPVQYTPQPGESVSFHVADGQRLSDAVRRFVTANNLTLDWDTGGADFQIRYGYQVNGPSMDAVLLNVLAPFRLSAVTRRGNGIVAVTRAS